jgi:hypothetical protein
VAGRSTNYRRTVSTLQGVLTGLYPSADAPIPVTTAADVDEILFANVEACGRLRRLLKSQREALKGPPLSSPHPARLRIRGAALHIDSWEGCGAPPPAKKKFKKPIKKRAAPPASLDPSINACALWMGGGRKMRFASMSTVSPGPRLRGHAQSGNERRVAKDGTAALLSGRLVPFFSLFLVF